MANIGYIQVVRHCNHFCGFCSNPSTPYTHNFASMKVLVDDFVARGYFGVILTGGEPTLHPELPAITRYATDQGLHVRMITNGTRLADRGFAKPLGEAGLQLVHVSVYSHKPEIEAQLRGLEGTLCRAYAAVDNANEFGIDVNINCVITKLNADHLDQNIRYWIEHHPHIRHFVWNNLDPSMGRAEVNQAQFTPRLADFELSLQRALMLLQKSGRTFRVEKVPLCFMTDFAWASTETRKIIKGEERIVHFLDDKQTVRQTDWEHISSDSCALCSVREICGGLFDRGDAYDPAELHPVFVDQGAIVEHVIHDATDPSYAHRTYAEWRADFDRRLAEAKAKAVAGRRPEEVSDRMPPPSMREALIPVGQVTERGTKLWKAKRRAEERKAAKSGVQMEDIESAATAEVAAVLDRD
jgi:organic radical activating enzyme